jgi:hypothetical protein
MKQKIQPGEREYQARLGSLLKDTFNTELRPLRSLQTVTKKRRALKRKAVKNSGVTKPAHDPESVERFSEKQALVLDPGDHAQARS